MQALADCLGAQARQLLFAREPQKKRRCHPPESAGTGTAPPDSAYVDTHMHAVAAVLDAALHAVPSAVLEAYVLPDHSTRSTHGPQSPAARAWRRRMRCDLVMDKVCKALEKLYLACAEATALDPVCLAPLRTLRTLPSRGCNRLLDDPRLPPTLRAASFHLRRPGVRERFSS